MSIDDKIKLINKYCTCPHCGNDKVGGDDGTIVIDKHTYTRACRCGWKITVTEKGKVLNEVIP